MLLKPALSEWRVLQRGMSGHDVAAWQTFQRFEPRPAVWPYTWPIAADGAFGAMTEAATKAFQERRGLRVTGIVDAETRGKVDPALFAYPAPDRIGLPPIRIVQARDWRWADRKVVDLIVLHSAEAGESASTAEAVAQYFLNPLKPSSCHFVVDSDSIVQCVRTQHIAAHAGVVNARSIGIEQAGYAKQTRNEWLDPYGMSMLNLLALLVARECKSWEIPVVHLSAVDLALGKRGLTDHATVNKAFPNNGNHWDPGPSYPWDVVLDLTTKAMAA